MQDEGRPGHQHLGVPVGGVMDRTAAVWANRLVDNEPASPVLEMTLLGPTIRFAGKGTVALTGANMRPQLNGSPLPMYENVWVNDGDTLRLGGAKTGCRTYLAVGGDWRVARWLNSVSAAPFVQPSPTPGSDIKKGNTLTIRTHEVVTKRWLPEAERPVFADTLVVTVDPGPEFERFTRTDIARFFGQTYRVTNESNRMGYRLQGTALNLSGMGNLISSGVLPGVVQITQAGQPVILMTDAQTVGGYPRIGVVRNADLDRLAQLRPGQFITFNWSN